MKHKRNVSLLHGQTKTMKMLKTNLVRHPWDKNARASIHVICLQICQFIGPIWTTKLSMLWEEIWFLMKTIGHRHAINILILLKMIQGWF